LPEKFSTTSTYPILDIAASDKMAASAARSSYPSKKTNQLQPHDDTWMHQLDNILLRLDPNQLLGSPNSSDHLGSNSESEVSELKLPPIPAEDSSESEDAELKSPLVPAHNSTYQSPSPFLKTSKYLSVFMSPTGIPFK
jgi:hypothetical protein